MQPRRAGQHDLDEHRGRLRGHHPLAANTPTSSTVSGLNVTGQVLRAFTGIANPAPGFTSNNLGVTGTGCSNPTSSGLTVWATRQNLTPITVTWMVIDLNAYGSRPV
ncbi:hypothetical protein ABZ920_22795 [Streptomyces sp. NPDC046831]|uniref:hypothetical protein n=1 Tax=Streptomyces sp. NPDC046831 TaxID=3154805 RepID=UPI0033FD4118